MNVSRVLLLTLVLTASTLAIVPSASATTCHAEPAEVEPVACGVVYTYFCLTQGGTPSHKTVASCLS